MSSTIKGPLGWKANPNELSNSERNTLADLVKQGYINLAGQDSEGNQLYEITSKGETYFNREEE
tara:strand:- start:493 stop:684 length:192 start_codon:yes stop_codon:yes gene_type:complete